MEVYTGDRDYAATDADVFIQIFGASSSTKEFQLAGRNLFGRGKYVLSIDHFYELLFRDVGSISNLGVRHFESTFFRNQKEVFSKNRKAIPLFIAKSWRHMKFRLI